MKKLKILLIVFILLSGIVITQNAESTAEETISPSIKNISPAMSKTKLLRYYLKAAMRSHRVVDGEERITFDYREKKKLKNTITFYLKDGKLIRWVIDDREEVATQYLMEFASASDNSYPKIYQALKNVLIKLPEAVFLSVTERDRPVVFLVNITSGIARFANSVEFFMRPNDPPTFKHGFYVIKLADELEDQGNIEAVEGIVFHELAHRYLEHLRQPRFSCDMEREANQLVKQWGFENEYQSARSAFGSKEPGDSNCQETRVDEEIN